MPSAYLQWRFHSGERVVARGPLVFFCVYEYLFHKIFSRMANNVLEQSNSWSPLCICYPVRTVEQISRTISINK